MGPVDGLADAIHLGTSLSWAEAWGAAEVAVEYLRDTGQMYRPIPAAPGPDPDGGVELTDEEFSTYLRHAKGEA